MSIQDTTTATMAVLTEHGVTVLEELAVITPSPAGMYPYAAAIVLLDPTTGVLRIRFDVEACECDFCEPDERVYRLDELAVITSWADVIEALVDQMEPETEEDHAELWQLVQDVRPALERVGA